MSSVPRILSRPGRPMIRWKRIIGRNGESRGWCVAKHFVDHGCKLAWFSAKTLGANVGKIKYSLDVFGETDA